MTVQIVDETPDPKIVREQICTSCGVRLRYLKPDVNHRVHRDYAGGSDDIFEIKCPKCDEVLCVKPWY